MIEGSLVISNLPDHNPAADIDLTRVERILERGETLADLFERHCGSRVLMLLSRILIDCQMRFCEAK